MLSFVTRSSTFSSRPLTVLKITKKNLYSTSFVKPPSSSIVKGPIALSLVTHKTFKRYYHSSHPLYDETKQVPRDEQEEKDEEVPTLEPPTYAELVEDLSSLKRVLHETTRALQETKEKLVHSYAERENIRRIANRDIETAKEFGIKSFALKLFDVIDTLDICIKNIPSEPETIENNVHVESALNGLLSSKKQFLKVMETYDVKELDVKPGQKFDPNFHNAVFEVQPTDPSQKPQTIGVVLKGGWIRKGVLLRPTHVGVIMKEYGQ